MIISTDQTGRIVHSPLQPQRIISLVPSQTELLFDVGLGNNLAGITRFCVHPENTFRTTTKVGGTKRIHHDIIRQLHPDLIIANKEENTRQDIELLTQHYPVWISDVHDFGSALEMIQLVGLITKTESEAAELSAEIINSYKELAESLMYIDILKRKLKAAYLIWLEPIMTVGSDTFIHSMMEKCGLINAFEDQLRYPVISAEEIISRDCNLLFLPSEPFPFSEKHVAEFERIFQGVQVLRVDGEMFSWYGSRMRLAPPYFKSLLSQISR
jgi:ABC-type Fe3+-hydroxamate transport system substrate-binding protein